MPITTTFIASKLMLIFFVFWRLINIKTIKRRTHESKAAPKAEATQNGKLLRLNKSY